MIQSLENQFREGETVQIKYFKVKKYAEEAKNLCFEGFKFIQFTTTTTVLPIQVVSNFIPQHVFVFTHLGDVSVCANQERFLIGIIF